MNKEILTSPLIIFFLLSIIGFSVGIGFEASKLTEYLRKYQETQLLQDSSTIEI